MFEFRTSPESFWSKAGSSGKLIFPEFCMFVVSGGLEDDEVLVNDPGRGGSGGGVCAAPPELLRLETGELPPTAAVALFAAGMGTGAAAAGEGEG